MSDSFYNITDSYFSTENIVKKVCQRLQARYRETIVVKKIGDRYGSVQEGCATLICSLENNNKFLFTVKYDMVNDILDY